MSMSWTNTSLGWGVVTTDQWSFKTSSAGPLRTALAHYEMFPGVHFDIAKELNLSPVFVLKAITVYLMEGLNGSSGNALT